ncbi:unnamed protein product [Rangifer tarandus platyrhynchus]|uniref:Uncharacterized protein n=2 Tax=Rangifer tarandus platyrhynchus TaxID=3082113 RepID=A0ABN8ZA27_RANTA|nr:unnamed protein product [Rangifer tarandus platyrhynchus]
MSFTAEDSDQISPCQSPFKQQDSFLVSLPWHSKESGTLGRFESSSSVHSQPLSHSPNFFTKSGSVFLVIGEPSPKHEMYSLELYILFRPFESCYPSRILIEKTDNTLLLWLTNCQEMNTTKSANPTWD